MVKIATLAVAVLLVAAGPAAARDTVVTSFDGTPIAVTFHAAAGLEEGERAPTILQTHGWGGTRERDSEAATSESTGNVGTGPLRHAGFNVLTWDSRGFGESGGVVTVDYRENEGRDVQALLDWLATQPEARLDGAGDPRAGMHGVSYAGGIELVAAAIDRRIDAIAPSIAWHSLLTALYRDRTVKTGWGTLLYAAGQSGTLDPHIHSAFQQGVATGDISEEDRAWFDSRGPTTLVDQIRVPTFLVQGTADTLFTPSEAIRNHERLRDSGAPLKMMWFCGGHGTCLTGAGTPGRLERAVIAWLQRHVAGRRVTTGPGFEWLADDARWRTTRAYPPRHGAPLVAQGSGTLVVNPADALSGQPVAAGRAVNAVNVAIPPPRRPTQVVGEPELTLTYSGTGTVRHVFAQIVDEARGVVLGNQVTPIPVTLDGAEHTVTRSLEGVAASLPKGGRYTLQVIGGSQVYGPVRGAGAVQLADVRLALPTAVGDLRSGGRAAGKRLVLPARRRCTDGQRFKLRLTRRVRRARVWVAGERARVRGRRVTADLRGVDRRRVGVRLRAGKLRERESYRSCAQRSR